ncbi:uncharacterized protein [Eurosta solidaginis]
MWKKASLPQTLLLLLLLLIALLLVQLVTTETTTQPTLNADDNSTNSSSSTDHSGAQALDIHDGHDEHDDDDHDWDEAFVETYETEEESSEMIRKATPLHLMINPAANSNKKEESETNLHESDYHDAEVDVHDGGSDSGDYVVGSSGSGAGIMDTDIGEGDSSGSGVDIEDSEELSEFDISERKRIASIMLRELSKIVDYALEQQRSVVNEFLQDETIEMVKCEAMEKIKKSCSAFMVGVRNILQLDKGENLLTQLISFGWKTLTAHNFETFVQQHNTTLIEQPTAENVIINNALKKAGIMQIEVELQKRILEFSKFFNTTVSEYVKRHLPQLLSNEQQLQQAQLQINDKLVLWYGEFALATNVSSQMMVLSKFFPMYKQIFLDALKND